jgi:hypothetical protein
MARILRIAGVGFAWLAIGICAWMGYQLFGRGVDASLTALGIWGVGGYGAYQRLTGGASQNP